MDAGILVQHVFYGLMLGVIYAMIAVGFSLFFGVLDVIKFSHGDVVTVGAFASLGSIADMVGPLIATQAFALAILPDSPVDLPGAPYLLAGLLVAASLALSWRVAKPV